MTTSGEAQWICHVTRRARDSQSHIRESPALRIAGMAGIQVAVRPNLCSKVQIGLKVPWRVALQFSVTAAWANPNPGRKRQMQEDLDLLEHHAGLFEGTHQFNGGWIWENVGRSADMNCEQVVISVTLLNIEWIDRADQLANELVVCREDHQVQIENISRQFESEIRQQRSLLQEADFKMNALRSDANKMKQESQEKVMALQHEIALLRGEMPAISKLDLAGLEELGALVMGAQARVSNLAKKMRQEDRLCKICFEGEANAALRACGHLILCMSCAQQIDHCPACRAAVDGVMQIFR